MATQFHETMPSVYTSQLEKTSDLSAQNDSLSTPFMPSIPEYSTFQHLVAVGKKDPGKLNWPQSIAIQEDTGHMYVSDWGKSCIYIFSEMGDYLDQFGHQHLIRPHGILIHEDSVYITDWRHHALFQFALPDNTMAKRVGKKGSGSKEFKDPRQLTVSPNQHLFVADSGNNRVQILDCKLNFKGSLQHKSMTRPVDVKFSINQMFVLSPYDNPCVHIFTLSGEKIRSIISNGHGMQVRRSLFFCLDTQNSILISDRGGDNVKVFSQEGDLLYTIGKYGHKYGMFVAPMGIAILNRTKLVCVSENIDHGLQIFSV